GHADVAADVAETRALDLDHLGALIGEQRDRVGPGERDREIDDLDARERQSLWSRSLRSPLHDAGWEGVGSLARFARRLLTHASNSALVRARPPGPLYARP